MVEEETLSDFQESRVSEDALDDTGYVMSIEVAHTTVDGQVKKATNTYYEFAGINTRSTKDMDNVAQADKEVALKRTGAYRVQLEPNANRTTAIEAGDLVAVGDTTPGKIMNLVDCAAYSDLGTPTNAKIVKFMKAIVGRAKEAIGAGADTVDGKLLVELGQS